MTANDDYIAEILVDVGLISSHEAEQGLAAASLEGRPVADVLSECGVASEIDILKAVANQFGMETISLAQVEIPPEVIEAVPAEVARRYKAVPVFQHEGALGVAISDPLDVETLDSLRFVLKQNIEGVVAPAQDIREAIRRFYPGGRDSVESMLTEMSAAPGAVIERGAGEGIFRDQDRRDSDAPIIRLVSLIIMEAFRNRASDIHLEPMERTFRVRYRIDGVLHEMESPPRRLQSAMISRIKIMANMSIAEKRTPQDGRIEIRIAERDLDLRVSSIPTNHGESIVMRILDKESLRLGLGQLGFFSDDQRTFERLTSAADGIFLVTGPTGCGKTTTLYACLNQLNQPDRKIITVEDPVEYQLSGVNQVQVRADIGMTFAAALRSILRQAPNVIMIGEIRDVETAEIAINASLTGHLVLSTLHTNDAPGAVTRLIDIGAKPFLVASSLRGILAQRLTRMICPDCVETYTPTEREVRALGAAAERFAGVELRRGRGCPACSQTGYRGRMGIFELLPIHDEIRAMIHEQASATDFQRKARELGMRSLREDGLRKVLAGRTTLEEVLRVTMGDLDE